MLIKKIAAATVVAAALVAPATASASYRITQGDAEVTTLGIAEKEYGDGWGVVATGSRCRPQGRGQGVDGRTWRGRYHRWVCLWVGTDFDDADVYGNFIVAGQSGGGYRYQAVFGGLRWL